MKHGFWKTLALCMAATAASASVAEVVLFQHEHFGGQRLEVNAAVANLARAAFNDSANSVVIDRGQWQLCVDADFQGACVTLGPGRYATLQQLGIENRVSSLRPVGGGGHPVGPGGQVPGPAGQLPGDRAAALFFLHEDFQGGSLGLDDSTPDLRQFDANDKASSLIVRRGHWQVCEDIGYRGRCVVFGPGRYPSMHPFGLNDAISSARPGGQEAQAPVPGFGAGGGRHPPAVRLDPIAACSEAAQARVRAEHPRAQRVQVNPQTVRARVDHQGATVVQGDGEVDARRHERRFRFECVVDGDGRGSSLTRLSYHE